MYLSHQDFERNSNKNFLRNIPKLELNYMYVGQLCYAVCKKPGQFDVIVIKYLAILFFLDEASMISGSIGMLASASLSESKSGLYEPIHGSAPDIAGLGGQNPLQQFSVAMMFVIHSGSA